MEIAEILILIWENILWIMAGFLTWLTFAFRSVTLFFSTKIAPFAAKARTTFGKKESGGSGQVAQTGMKYGRNPKAALLMAQQRRQQMQEYIDTWENLIYNKWGPYAMCVRLHGFMHESMLDKYRRKKERLQEFDSLEDRAQQLVHQFDSDREAVRIELVNQLQKLNACLANNLARQMNLARRPFSKRSKAVRRRLKRTGMAMGKMHLRLYFAEYEVIRKYRPLMAPLAAEVEFFAKEWLDNWMESFAADVTSMELSAISGNVRRYLTANMPERQALRKELMLTEHPLDDASISAFLKPYGTPVLQDLDGAASAPETQFEMYLRIRLFECEQMREAWGVNLTYLEQIAAPGSLGISHARYMQLGSNLDWFSISKPPTLPSFAKRREARGAE